VRDKNEVHPGILALILAGIFLGGGVNVFLAMRTFITLDMLFNVFFLSGAASMALYYILRWENRRYFLEVAGFSFAGIGSLVVAFMLALNFAFHQGREARTFTGDFKRNPPAEVILAKDSSFKNYPYLLYFEDMENNPGRLIREIRITTAIGLVGYRIILNREIVYQ
jgi:hypothetical protein